MTMTMLQHGDATVATCQLPLTCQAVVVVLRQLVVSYQAVVVVVVVGGGYTLRTTLCNISNTCLCTTRWWRQTCNRTVVVPRPYDIVYTKLAVVVMCII